VTEELLAYAELDLTAQPHTAIVVTTNWREKELIQQVPGARWQGREKVWRLPRAWASCVILRGVFGDDLHVGPTLAEWSWQYHQAVIAVGAYLRDMTAWPEQWPRDLIANLDPEMYDFQEVGSAFLAIIREAVLGDDMGAGKTIQALAALNTLLKGQALPGLVLCPNSVKGQWSEETKRWFPDANTYVLRGGAAARRKILKEAFDDPNALVMLNLESARLFSRLAPYGSIELRRCAACDPQHGDSALTPSRCEVHQKEFNGFGFKTVILDEAHRIADPQSKVTRASWAIMHDPSVEIRWAMTGTLITKHVADAWSIFHAVAPLEFPVKTKFIDRFCLTGFGGWGGMEIIGLRPDTKQEFFSIINPRYRRMPKALVLQQLPPKIRTVREADMTATQARMYKELGRDLTAVTEDGELLIAANNLTAQVRLLQLAASEVDITKPDEDDPTTWEVRLKEPSPRLDVMEEIIDELDGASFAVCSEHLQLLELAAARLRKKEIRFGMIAGPVSEVDRDAARKGLETGTLQGVLFVMKAGGVGLNLTAAGTLIRLQRSWSMVDNVQAENRVHRIGSEQHDSVNIVDIIAPGTVEERQVERLYAKLASLEEINQDRARLLREGVDITALDEQEAVLMNTFLGRD
jgi:SNF2 family DNA or RNA helicase